MIEFIKAIYYVAEKVIKLLQN